MKLEGYIVEIIHKIGERGYPVYLAGNTIIMHILGRPIKEYDLFTSAPFFSLSKKEEVKANTLSVLEYKKPVTIHFLLRKEEYYETCVFGIDTILYQRQYGIIDEKHQLNSLLKREFTFWKKENIEDNPLRILDALYYVGKYQFSLKKDVKNYIISYQKGFSFSSKRRMKTYLEKFLLLEDPSTLFYEFQNIFSYFFPIRLYALQVLKYTKCDVSLRISAIFCGFELPFCENFLNEFGFLKNIKDEVIFILTEHSSIELSKNEKRKQHLWFSLRRAKCLAENNLSFLAKLDQEEESLHLKK